ncbi:MAG: helix-turn-helix domain-containing protein [Clostridia bacterium]|nr:helix-turn-helix domain-containing protein [Clostridia bacterium]
MEYKETMGKRISDLRKGKGMTQEQLAQLLGVTPQAVSKWENDLSCPDISILPQLAEALGVTTDELLGRTPLRISEGSDKCNGKSHAHVSVRLRLNQAEKIIFALLLMGIGLIFLLNAFHVIELGEGVTFGSVLWPFLVACMGVMACRSELNPISIGLFLFGVYMLLFNLGIIPAQYKLTWAMAWPVALILIGVTILLHFLLPKRKKEGGIFEVEKSDPVFDCTDESGFIRIDSAFTSQTKCVETGAPFTGAKIDSSFGSLVLDLSQAEIQNGALIDADVSFCSLTVRLPAFVGANAACKTAFGGYDCPPGNPDAEIKVSLNGDVSFGKIEVEYV